MPGVANCSEIILTLLKMVLHSAQLALSLEVCILVYGRLKHFLHFKLM